MIASARRRDLPELPTHPALTRPILIGGVERELVLIEVLVGMTLIGIAQVSLLSLLAIVAIALLHFQLLVPAGAADPDLAKVYLRHLRYKPYYRAAGRLTDSPPNLPAGR